MKTKFGVDSATPINKRLKNGYTMYDWVMRQKGFPSFCMRTLSGDGKLTSEEIEFLRAKDCKIGLVIRDFTEAMISTYNGTKDALKAIEAAKELGVPQNSGIALFVEVRPEWSINHNWMISFAKTLSENGYIPGFIGNTDSSKNFNFDRQTSHYVKATKKAGRFGAVFMATEPKCKSMPENWEPYCPSALSPDDIDLWCCGTTTFDNVQVCDVYAKNKEMLEKMW